MPRLGWTNDDDDNATAQPSQASEHPAQTAQAAQTAPAAPLSTADRWERAQSRLDRAIEAKRRAGIAAPLAFMLLLTPACYALAFAILISGGSYTQTAGALWAALNVLAGVAECGGLIWFLLRIAKRVSASDEVEAARAELQKVENQLNREAMARR